VVAPGERRRDREEGPLGRRARVRDGGEQRASGGRRRCWKYLREMEMQGRKLADTKEERHTKSSCGSTHNYAFPLISLILN
jgi:hypothetical protein